DAGERHAHSGTVAHGPGALPEGLVAERDCETDSGRSRKISTAKSRNSEERPGRRGLRSRAVELLPYYCTVRRTRRTATSRSGQCSAGEQHNAAGSRDAIAANHGGVHGCGGLPRADSTAHQPRNTAERGRV